MAWMLISATQIAQGSPTTERYQSYESRSRLGAVEGKGLLYCDPSTKDACKAVLYFEGRVYSIKNKQFVEGLVKQTDDAVMVNFHGEVVKTSIFGRDRINLAKVDLVGEATKPIIPKATGSFPPNTPLQLKK
jgi:hypothetical protein